MRQWMPDKDNLAGWQEDGEDDRGHNEDDGYSKDNASEDGVDRKQIVNQSRKKQQHSDLKES